MTREERKTELLTIANHLSSVVEDLMDYRDRLEEANSKRGAKRLDTIIGSLYNLQWDLADKTKG